MAQRGTVIRKILGRKLQKVVDGQVADRRDRDGNVQPYWTLIFDYMTQQGLVERKVNVFPNQFSGGRNGETMFWTRQDLRGLVNTIKSIQPGQEEVLPEPIQAIVEYDGKWWELRDIGRTLNEAAESTASAPTTSGSSGSDSQVQQNAADISEMKSDLDAIKQMMQQLLNQQK